MFVPAYPHTEGSRKDIVFELRTSAADEVVAIAFSSVRTLVATLGHCQPWMRVSTGKFRTYMAALGIKNVIVDPQLDAAPQRLDAQRVQRMTGGR